MSKSRLTFKKGQEQTGLARVSEPYPSTDIKINGLVVGAISPPHWSQSCDKWKVRFAVKTEPNGFKWITMKQRHHNEDDARGWVKNLIDKVIAKYDLHSFEKD